MGEKQHFVHALPVLIAFFNFFPDKIIGDSAIWILGGISAESRSSALRL